jgi:hypothetical protein
LVDTTREVAPWHLIGPNTHDINSLRNNRLVGMLHLELIRGHSHWHASFSKKIRGRGHSRRNILILVIGKEAMLALHVRNDFTVRRGCTPIAAPVCVRISV